MCFSEFGVIQICGLVFGSHEVSRFPDLGIKGPPEGMKAHGFRGGPILSFHSSGPEVLIMSALINLMVAVVGALSQPDV